MKKLLSILFFVVVSVATVHAQGTVTVHQSTDIDALVNGKKAAPKTKKQIREEKKAAKAAAKEMKKRREQAKSGAVVPTPRPQVTIPAPVSQPVPQAEQPQPAPTVPSAPRTKIVRRLVRKPHTPDPYGVGDTQLVTKRLMHTIKKVRGFRVQVYSGGNTRVAHQEADRAGQKAKSVFPNQPVYVHFYTPRWMCLVGNFTNYKQARTVMRRMRKEGYPNANVIRTMISVKTTKVVSQTVIDPIKSAGSLEPALE